MTSAYFMKKLLIHRNNINLYSKLKKRNIYIFHICTFKVYLDNMPDEPYICRGEEQFSYVHCLLFLFDLCLFANDPRFPISRFIVYQLLLLLDYTYIQGFMVRRFLLTAHWELFTRTFSIKVSEIQGGRARS